MTWADGLVVTSSLPLTPPTPSLRRAEFFSKVITCDTTALVSLWIGVLSCVELELEKEKRKVTDRLVFKENYNIK